MRPEVQVNDQSTTSTKSSRSTANGDVATNVTTPLTDLSTTSTVASNDSPLTRNIRVLKWYDRSGINEAAHSLAKAFEDDEMSKYFTHVPDLKADERWKVHFFIMKCLVKAHVFYGETTVIGPNSDCVALWMPPGKNIDGFMPMLVSGMNRFNFWFHVSKEGCKRFFDDFLPRLHQEKQDVLKADDNNSWYLVYIGTKPESRGKGYAGDLIAHTAKKADAQGLLCYLESSNLKNRALYNKHGFHDEKRIEFTRSDPVVPLWIMTRKPHAGPVGPDQTRQPDKPNGYDESE